MSEQNHNQELLHQYLESIRDQEERKKAEQKLRISRLNIGIAILLSLLMPLLGYSYTRRWKEFLWLLCGFGIFGGVMGVTFVNDEKAIEKIFGVASIAAPIVASVDNTLAISKAKKEMEDLLK